MLALNSGGTPPRLACWVSRRLGASREPAAGFVAICSLARKSAVKSSQVFART
jgi:hypothetical protein